MKESGKIKREFLGIPFENFKRMFPVPAQTDFRDIEDRIVDAEIIGTCEDCGGDVVHAKKGDIVYCKNCGKVT